MRRQILNAMTLIALLLAGCSPVTIPTPATSTSPAIPQATSAPETAAIAESPLPAPTTVAESAPSGTLSATGTVYTTASGGRQPMSDTTVRLAKVIWNADKSDGAFVLEGGTSPIATTDGSGVFTFRELPPGDYVIVVGDVYGKHEIISEPDGKAAIYTVATEGPAAWGDVVVSLAP